MNPNRNTNNIPTSSDDESRQQWDLNPLVLSSGTRKSAFLPYKPTNTVLTNLQRGNTEASINNEISLNFHEKSGQGEITKEQIDQLASVDVVDSNKFTPLHWACYYGQISAATLLIELSLSHPLLLQQNFN